MVLRVLVCLSVCLSVCMYVCMYLCLSINQSVCLSICMSACIYFVCLHVFMFVCLIVCLSKFLFRFHQLYLFDTRNFMLWGILILQLLFFSSCYFYFVLFSHFFSRYLNVFTCILLFLRLFVNIVL